MKICAYCGKESPETKDHIPPKNLFGKPLPSDLITVPCCFKCHEGTSKDDEYFRSVVVSWEALDGMLYVEAARDTVIRSLQRKESAGFAKSTIASISEIVSYTRSGIYIGKQDAMKIDESRVKRVLERIARGLFFKETCKIAGKDADVKINIVITADEQLFQAFLKHGPWNWKTYADKQFSYAFKSDGEISILLMDIFGKFGAIGRIRPIPEK